VIRLIAISVRDYKATMPGGWSDDGLRLSKRTFELLAAAHHDPSVSFDRFVLRKRMKPAGSNLVG
jgi:hypothetical protein